MPSAVSCVLRQVFYLGLGLLFLGIFGNYGEKVSLLLKRDDFTAMYGAMGVALGILISELLVTLFLFVIYRGSMSGRRENENGMKGTDSFAGQIGSLFPGIGGDILRQLLFRCRYGWDSFCFRDSRRIFMHLQNNTECLPEDIW